MNPDLAAGPIPLTAEEGAPDVSGPCLLLKSPPRVRENGVDCLLDLFVLVLGRVTVSMPLAFDDR